MSGNTKRSGQDWKSSDLRNELIKEAISKIDLRSAMEFYGVSFNQKGAALCPFHKEKTASFLLKNGNKGPFWHCFGCGESGDLIQFVRKRFNQRYSEAIDTICRDFHITQDEKLRISDRERIDSVRIQQYNSKRHYKLLLDELDKETARYWRAYDIRELAARHGGATPDNDVYVSAQFLLLRARSSLERAEAACVEYLIENPNATPMPPVKPPQTVRLPPAPKWRIVQDDDPVDHNGKEVNSIG